MKSCLHSVHSREEGDSEQLGMKAVLLAAQLCDLSLVAFPFGKWDISSTCLVRLVGEKE
jgi:hypothetical protein